jgi:hypothetical protein
LRNILPLSPGASSRLFFWSLSESSSKKSSLEPGKHSKPSQYQKRTESIEILCLGRWTTVVGRGGRETQAKSSGRTGVEAVCQPAKVLPRDAMWRSVLQGIKARYSLCKSEFPIFCKWRS